MKKIRKKILRMTLRIILGFIGITFLWVLTYRFVNPPITYLMIKRHFEEDYPIQQEWRDFDEISWYFPMAVISAEDQNFKNHFGFDVDAIEKAISYNEDHQKTRGASTISQQVAKNVFLWPGRSWIRKGLEVWFTFLEELLWSKQRIIEVYMNVVELGPGIYGVEAAAEQYYHRSASTISERQAALLAASLPNPFRLSAQYPTAYMNRRSNWIAQQIRNLGGQEYLKRMD